MDDLLTRLDAPLEGRYRLLRELGRGGMARVYLAQDLRLERQVAVKIMRPDIAATVGRDRFLREIDLTSHLSHPNIVQLYDSGEADGLVYYVMPCVEGETLRQRLEREGQLPIDDALRITREVAAALEYAHEAGIVHRDVKPANIMLSGDQVLVTDFGIARALATASGDTLTETGLALGSAHYMSPEQATASSKLDARSDQYSLACVVFEMLTGEQPFTGHSVQAIIARQAVESAPGLRLLRETIPSSVETAVRRALSKIPADRFASIRKFVEALEAPADDKVPVHDWARRMAPWALGLGAVAAGLSLFFAFQLRPRSNDPQVQRAFERSIPQPLLVAPLVVEGARPSALSAEALTGLLTRALSGEGGIQVIRADSALAWWQLVESGAVSGPGEVLGGAAGLGAEAIVHTSLIQTESGWRLTAVVLEAPAGNERLRVENLTTPGDGLSGLIEELAKHLLIHNAEEERHLGGLLVQDLPEVKAYLAGLASYRSGRYAESVERLERAVTLDSTFALAAVDLAVAAGFLGGENAFSIESRALSRAWANRHRLGVADSSFLVALAGNEYPNLTTARQRVTRWEHIVDQVPGRWESSFHLGMLLSEYGRLLDLDVPLRRASTAFHQILESRPQFAPALEYAIQLAAVVRDTAELAPLVEAYLGSGIERDRSDFVRWLASTSSLEGYDRDLELLLQEMDDEKLGLVVGYSQLTGSDVESGESAAGLIQERTVGQAEHWLASIDWRILALNLGRPQQAAAFDATSPVTIPAPPLIRLVEAMYWDGDTTVARLAVEDRLPLPGAPPPVPPGADQADSVDSRVSYLMDACTLGLWGLYEGDLELAREMAGRLEISPVLRQQARWTFVLYCRRLLDAEVTAAIGDPSAKQKVDDLESLLLEGLTGNPWISLAARMGLARLRETAGDAPRALAAVRRRQVTFSTWGIIGLSSLLANEGRLAEEVGDHDSAIRAYRHYLALRYRPEPGLEPEVAAIRERLATLESSRLMEPDP